MLEIFHDFKENKNYADPKTSNTTGNAQGLANVGQYIHILERMVSH
jgi:hypothetical protein